jgi:hypothetical protein
MNTDLCMVLDSEMFCDEDCVKSTNETISIDDKQYHIILVKHSIQIKTFLL